VSLVYLREDPKTPTRWEGLTIPHYRRIPCHTGDIWSLAIWLGLYEPRTRRWHPSARVAVGSLWVLTRASVDVPPIERNAVPLVDWPTTTPTQSVDERDASPRRLLELRSEQP